MKFQQFYKLPQNIFFLAVILRYFGGSLILIILYLIFKILLNIHELPPHSHRTQFTFPSKPTRHSCRHRHRHHRCRHCHHCHRRRYVHLHPFMSSLAFSSLSFFLSLTCSFDSERNFTSDLVISIFGFFNFSIYGFYLWFRV